MPRPSSLLARTAAAALFVLSVSCGGKSDDTPPVATPSLTLNHSNVPIGSPVKLTYKFVVAPDATFDRNYWIFVHVLDPTSGRQRFGWGCTTGTAATGSR